MKRFIVLQRKFGSPLLNSPTLFEPLGNTARITMLRHQPAPLLCKDGCSGRRKSVRIIQKKFWETERAVTCCNYTLWHTVTHHWPTFLLRGLGQAGCSGTQPRISRPWMSNFSNWESWKDSKCFSAWTQNTYHNNTRTQTSTSVTFSRLIQSSSHGVHGMCQQGASYMSRCS